MTSSSTAIRRRVPVASRDGLPGGLGGSPVLPEPPGGATVQVTPKVRGLAPEFQPSTSASSGW